MSVDLSGMSSFILFFLDRKVDLLADVSEKGSKPKLSWVQGPPSAPGAAIRDHLTP